MKRNRNLTHLVRDSWCLTIFNSISGTMCKKISFYIGEQLSWSLLTIFRKDHEILDITLKQITKVIMREVSFR